jgi:hypothetical protein
VNLLNEGSASSDQPASSEGKSTTTSVASSEGARLVPSQQSGSQEPLSQSGNATAQKSKDSPLLGVPTLEAAESSGARKEARGERGEVEEGGRYAAVTKSNGQYDKVGGGEGGGNAEDEAGYAYATVGGAAGKDPAKPSEPSGDDARDSREDKDKNNEKAAGLPPYGKVTRHMVPMKRSGYSEVLTSLPLLPPGRPRATTEPIDPEQPPQGPAQGMRDERAFTESAAHLPLPQIPKLEVSEETYDSIPEEFRESASTAANGEGAAGGGASGAKLGNAPAARDSLYESVEVEEGGKAEGAADEDVYESVPEDIRPTAPTPSSPEALSPSSPLPPAPRSPTVTRMRAEGSGSTPPASPSQKQKDEDDGRKKGKDHHAAKESKSDQKKHKVLSKAKSDTGTEGRGRSLSSLFSRRKGGSTSTSSSTPSPVPRREKNQHEPLPKVPTVGFMPSPTHLVPPSPPPMPAPPPPEDDDEEDEYPSDGAYDMIDVINPRGAALLKNRDSDTVKAKSASLPASMRGSGASVLHGGVDHGPLPQVPEESEGGLVTRHRVPEDMDPEYDTVVLGQVQDEPSYDCVEAPSREADAVPKLEPAEPAGAVVEAAEPEGGQTPANKYARVSSHVGVDVLSPPELSAVAPEHDELGYAVIPAHMKMRKRAMSDAVERKEQAARRMRAKSFDLEEPGYDKIKASSGAAEEGGGDGTLDVSPPMEPEYESVTDAMKKESSDAGGSGEDDKKETPYATVDMAAKRRSQMLRQQSSGMNVLADADEALPREASPNPPPLPQQGDLGDLSEFQKPPVPVQAEASLLLIDLSDLQPPPGTVVNPYSQIDVLPPQDPPYASVKKKSDTEKEAKSKEEEENPYSTVDNCDSVAVAPGQNDSPYAKIQKGQLVADKEEDPGPGYAKAGHKCLTGSGEVSTVAENMNGTRHPDNGEDEDDGTYDRLDHGLGNAASCRGSAGVDGERAYATVTVDFSTSPELVVTHADGTTSDSNGAVRQVEETTIDFTE